MADPIQHTIPVRLTLAAIADGHNHFTAITTYTRLAGGTVGPVLERLFTRGYATCVRVPSPCGGPSRRVFTLTADGERLAAAIGERRGQESPCGS